VLSLQTLARIFHELLSQDHKDSEVLHYEEFPDYEEFPESAEMKPPGACMPCGGCQKNLSFSFLKASGK
jgi:hypothetical protein